jgi:hypothetical protein
MKLSTTFVVRTFEYAIAAAPNAAAYFLTAFMVVCLSVGRVNAQDGLTSPLDTILPKYEIKATSESFITQHLSDSLLIGSGTTYVETEQMAARDNTSTTITACSGCNKCISGCNDRIYNICAGQSINLSTTVKNFSNTTFSDVRYYVSAAWFNGSYNSNAVGLQGTGVYIAPNGTATVNFALYNFPVGEHVLDIKLTQCDGSCYVVLTPIRLIVNVSAAPATPSPYVSAVTSSSITFAWSPVAGASSYLVYDCLTGVTTTTTNTSVTFSGLGAGVTRSIKVSAVGGNCGSSSYSNCQSATTVASAPEITVSEGSNNVNTNTSWAINNPTSVGSSKAINYSIRNDGNGTLYINNLSVTGQYFSVGQYPSSSLSGGWSSGYTINFTPLATGTYTATVTITNNDPDENTFIYYLQATAINAPKIAVKHEGTNSEADSIALVEFRDGFNYRMASSVKVNDMHLFEKSKDGIERFSLPKMPLAEIGSFMLKIPNGTEQQAVLEYTDIELQDIQTWTGALSDGSSVSIQQMESGRVFMSYYDPTTGDTYTYDSSDNNPKWQIKTKITAPHECGTKSDTSQIAAKMICNFDCSDCQSNLNYESGDETVITALVCVSAEALNAVNGDIDSIRQNVNLDNTATNEISRKSGAKIRLQILDVIGPVSNVDINPLDADFANTINAVQNSTFINKKREFYGADIVVLVTEKQRFPNAGAQAQAIPSCHNLTTKNYQPYIFVIPYERLQDRLFTYAHELGHLLGLVHGHEPNTQSIQPCGKGQMGNDWGDPMDNIGEGGVKQIAGLWATPNKTYNQAHDFPASNSNGDIASGSYSGSNQVCVINKFRNTIAGYKTDNILLTNENVGTILSVTDITHNLGTKAIVSIQSANGTVPLPTANNPLQISSGTVYRIIITPNWSQVKRKQQGIVTINSNDPTTPTKQIKVKLNGKNKPVTAIEVSINRASVYGSAVTGAVITRTIEGVSEQVGVSDDAGSAQLICQKPGLGVTDTLIMQANGYEPVLKTVSQAEIDWHHLTFIPFENTDVNAIVSARIELLCPRIVQQPLASVKIAFNRNVQSAEARINGVWQIVTPNAPFLYPLEFGKNTLKGRVYNNGTMQEISNTVYYIPADSLAKYADTVIIRADASAANATLMIDDLVWSKLQFGTNIIQKISKGGSSMFRIFKHGYIDAFSLSVPGASDVNLSLQPRIVPTYNLTIGNFQAQPIQDVEAMTIKYIGSSSINAQRYQRTDNTQNWLSESFIVTKLNNDNLPVSFNAYLDAIPNFENEQYALHIVNNGITSIIVPQQFGNNIKFDPIHQVLKVFNAISGAEYTLMRTGSTLPIKLLDFTATITQNCQPLLKWQTASEQNNKQFDILRSYDGKAFEHLVTVAGAGSTSIVQDYSFAAPKEEAKLVHYTLKSIDFDGKTYQHRTVSLSNENCGAGVITFIPNPAKDLVSIESEKSILSVTIVNELGQVIITQSCNNQTRIPIDISSLAEGIYFVNIAVNNGSVSHQKLIVTH